MWDFTDFETDVRKTKNLAAGIEFAAELSERNASFLLQIQLLACRQVFVVFLHTRNGNEVPHFSFPDAIIHLCCIWILSDHLRPHVSDKFNYLQSCNIYKCQFLYVCIFKTGYQSPGSVNRRQYIYTGLNGISADDKSIFRMFCPLCRNIDNKVNLMSQNQIKKVR